MRWCQGRLGVDVAVLGAVPAHSARCGSSFGWALEHCGAQGRLLFLPRRTRSATLSRPDRPSRSPTLWRPGAGLDWLFSEIAAVKPGVAISRKRCRCPTRSRTRRPSISRRSIRSTAIAGHSSSTGSRRRTPLEGRPGAMGRLVNGPRGCGSFGGWVRVPACLAFRAGTAPAGLVSLVSGAAGGRCCRWAVRCRSARPALHRSQASAARISRLTLTRSFCWEETGVGSPACRRGA